MNIKRENRWYHCQYFVVFIYGPLEQISHLYWPMLNRPCYFGLCGIRLRGQAACFNRADELPR
jgi:hypothetical protein